MEGKNMKVAALAMAFCMIIFIGQTTARFDQCYAECYFQCIIDMKKIIPYVPKKFLPCAWKCLKKCIFHPGNPAESYYCNLGCTIDTCGENIDDGEKMGGCFNNCSNASCKATR